MDATPTSALAAVAAAQHGVFTTTQALAAGLRPGQLVRQTAAGSWLDLGRGLFRVAAAPCTWEQRCWLALLEAPSGAVLSHATAARRHGFAGFAEARGVHVLAPVGLDHRARHARLHQTRDLPEHHRVLREGLPTTSMARTLFDLAASTHPERMAHLVDDALSRRGLGIDDLSAVVLGLAKRGRRGSRAMRSIVAARLDTHVPPESVLEAEFLDLCRRSGLPEPERQVTLGDDAAPIGRVDALFRPEGLVVEVDGRPFHSSLTDRERDRERDNRLMASGLRVLRLGWHEVVRDPARAVQLVSRALAGSGAPSRVPASRAA